MSERVLYHAAELEAAMQRSRLHMTQMRGAMDLADWRRAEEQRLLMLLALEDWSEHLLRGCQEAFLRGEAG